METTTELKIWLEKALDACANEGGTNFLREIILQLELAETGSYYLLKNNKITAEKQDPGKFGKLYSQKNASRRKRLAALSSRTPGTNTLTARRKTNLLEIFT